MALPTEHQILQKIGAYGMSYRTAVSRGMVPNAIPFGAYGEKMAIGSDSGVLWPDGAYDIPPHPGGLNQMEIASTSDEDAVGGNGIESIHVHYLDADLNPVEQLEAVTGTTPRTITFPDNCRFLQCSHIGAFGSLAEAAGDIEIRAVGDGQIYSYIAAGATRCSSSVRMVPKGKRLLVMGAIGGSASGTAAASTIVRVAANVIGHHEYIDPLAFIPFGSNAYQDNSFGMTFDPPFPFLEGNIVTLLFTTDKAAIITGTWFGVLEDE